MTTTPKGCGRYMIDPNEVPMYCGQVEFCDDCVEAWLEAIGYNDDYVE